MAVGYLYFLRYMPIIIMMMMMFCSRTWHHSWSPQTLVPPDIQGQDTIENVSVDCQQYGGRELHLHMVQRSQNTSQVFRNSCRSTQCKGDLIFFIVRFKLFNSSLVGLFLLPHWMVVHEEASKSYLWR